MQQNPWGLSAGFLSGQDTGFSQMFQPAAQLESAQAGNLINTLMQSPNTPWDVAAGAGQLQQIGQSGLLDTLLPQIQQLFSPQQPQVQQTEPQQTQQPEPQQPTTPRITPPNVGGGGLLSTNLSPDGRTMEQIRATGDYQSFEERLWFLSNLAQPKTVDPNSNKAVPLQPVQEQKPVQPQTQPTAPKAPTNVPVRGPMNTIPPGTNFRGALIGPQGVQFPAQVEQWRPYVAQVWPADQVDRALWAILLESNGDPGIKNPTSTATGLFQNLGGSTDIMENIKQGYQKYLSSLQAYPAGQGWAPWGWNNLYNGAPFGALGVHGFPAPLRP